MKYHTTGVAKVVNPLGTVVTVQSDDDDDVESAAEEIIIHENCDEALFRPVVASKAVLFAEPKNVQNKISHSVLHVNKTPDFIRDSRSKVTDAKSDFYSEVDSGVEKYDPTYQKRPKNNVVPIKSAAVSERKFSKMCCDISSSIDDLPDTFVPITESDNYKKAIKFETPDPLGSLDFAIDDLTLNTTKSPDVILQKGNNKEKNYKSDKYHHEQEPAKEMISSSEENAAEEKHLPKKTRKPKTKLGVRITSVSKDLNEEHEKEGDNYVEFTMPLPKKSWSAVAASQPQKAKTSSTQIEQKIILPEIESVAPFPVPSTKCKSTLEEADKQTTEGPHKIKYDFDDFNFLKVDKSSDEEKPENTSSQTETTESDDSSKVKVESTAMDTEEDSCQPEIIESSLVSVQTSKKKSKKKRR